MIRLLTFGRLSLLRERDTDAAMAAEIDALSGVATTCHCHLLQRSASGHLLNALGTEQQQSRLQAALSGRSAEVRLLSAADEPGDQIPAWLSPVQERVQNPQDVETLGAWWTTVDSDVEFRWLHLDPAAADPPGVWVAAGLRLAMQALAASAQETLIVTSTAGESEDSGRFESLLWEGSIRVPLWLAGDRTEPGWIHWPTGSHDVLETVLAAVGASGQSSGPDSPMDLSKVSATDSTGQQRRIQIADSRCDAVRTIDFMLVRERMEGLDGRVALYEKPHDLWNVHDVSREYPQVVDDLLALMTPSETPGDSGIPGLGSVSG